MQSVEKPFFVASDIHLGAVPAETEQAFRAFLVYAFNHASGLLINGDLFDVWVPSSRYVMRGYVRVLAAMANLTEAGFPVYFVGGNHDASEYGGRVLEQDCGIRLLPDPSLVQLGAYRALVVHGDGVRAEGKQYTKENRALRRLLRINWLRALAERAIPLDWLSESASRWSRVPGIVARYERGEGTGPKLDAERLEAWAAQQIRNSKDMNLVLAGHSHLPAWREVEPGRYYINTGDWIEHLTYAALPATAGLPTLRRWPTHEVLFPSDVVAPPTDAGVTAQL
jgi:UDP-2,3-diacylglucosamine hydrolase